MVDVVDRPLPPREPRFLAAEDTSIKIEWDAISTLNYRIQYKEYLQTWEEATSINVPTGQNTMITALSDLQPCATYCVRIVAIGQNNVESLAGPEIVIDTAAANCTPRTKKACCIC
ncbi:low quality protein: proto-oncogene tyrosine-protein kinase ros [Nannochloropsis oceanica]